MTRPRFEVLEAGPLLWRIRDNERQLIEYVVMIGGAFARLDVTDEEARRARRRAVEGPGMSEREQVARKLVQRCASELARELIPTNPPPPPEPATVVDHHPSRHPALIPFPIWPETRGRP